MNEMQLGTALPERGATLTTAEVHTHAHHRGGGACHVGRAAGLGPVKSQTSGADMQTNSLESQQEVGTGNMPDRNGLQKATDSCNNVSVWGSDKMKDAKYC
jgi:hypothetical protein